MISQVMSVGRHLAVALLASIAVGYSAGELFGASDPVWGRRAIRWKVSPIIGR